MVSCSTLGLVCVHLIACVEAFVLYSRPAHRSLLTSFFRLRDIKNVAQAEADDLSSKWTKLTQNQIKTLRKEISKRRAAKTLSQIWLNDAETSGPFSDETFSGIVDLLREHELVEVRGIAKDDKKTVFATSQQLAFELSLAADKPVVLVEHSGHAGIFYCSGDRIILRTSFRDRGWTKRQKAARNHRGQVIREDLG